MDRVVKASLSIDPIPAACDTASTTPSSSVVPGDTVGRAVRRLAIGGVEPDGMGTWSMALAHSPRASGHSPVKALLGKLRAERCVLRLLSSLPKRSLLAAIPS